MIAGRWIFQECTHFIQGFLYSFVAAKILCARTWWVGMLVGIGVELYQYFGPDKRDLRLLDRLLDFSFWTFGGTCILIFI